MTSFTAGASIANSVASNCMVPMPEPVPLIVKVSTAATEIGKASRKTAAAPTTPRRARHRRAMS